MVGISREISKGPAGNPVVVDNAELLKSRYIEKFSEPNVVRTSSATTPAKKQDDPAAVPARSLAPTNVLAENPTSLQAPASPSPSKASPQRSVPGFMMDRRYVERPASSKPLFSMISDEYLAARRVKSGDDNADVETARFRRDLFIELIGDHPVDTYTATDLQAYVSMLKFWPANVKDRPQGLNAWEIIDANRDLSRKPIGIKTLREGYVANIKSMIRSQITEYDYSDPFAGARIFYLYLIHI